MSYQIQGIVPQQAVYVSRAPADLLAELSLSGLKIPKNTLEELKED